MVLTIKLERLVMRTAIFLRRELRAQNWNVFIINLKKCMPILFSECFKATSDLLDK